MNRMICPFRLILLFGILVSPVMNLSAQDFNAGIFGGITASQVDGDYYSGYNKLGISAGGFVNREIGYDIYWQLEIKYVTRGVYKGPGTNDPFIYSSTYHYVELPLSAHYLYDKRIQVEAGFSPEVLISAIFADEDGVLDPEQNPDNRRLGLSVFGGVYYWFKNSMGIGVRFTYSAIPFRDPQEWNSYLNRGFYHNVICLSAAYKFLHP